MMARRGIKFLHGGTTSTQTVSLYSAGNKLWGSVGGHETNLQLSYRGTSLLCYYVALAANYGVTSVIVVGSR